MIKNKGIRIVYPYFLQSSKIPLNPPCRHKKTVKRRRRISTKGFSRRNEYHAALFNSVAVNAVEFG